MLLILLLIINVVWSGSAGIGYLVIGAMINSWMQMTRRTAVALSAVVMLAIIFEPRNAFVRVCMNCINGALMHNHMT